MREPLPSSSDRSRAYLTTLVVLITVSGCLAGLDLGSDDVRIPLPEIGTSVVYEGSNDGILYVNVTGMEKRLDHNLQSHDALILSITYRGNESQDIFNYDEAIEPSDGLTVHEVSVCGRKVDERSTCYDNRSGVFFGMSKLPAGFLMGPLWNQTFTPGDSYNLDIERAGHVNDAHTYLFSKTDKGRDDASCLRLDMEPALNASSEFPFSARDGPQVVCDTLPFPYSFISVERETFQMTHYEKGDTPTQPNEDGVWTSDTPGLPLRTWSPPLVVHDETDPAPFTVKEAHQEALSEETRYEGFFQRNPDALVVYSDFLWKSMGQQIQVIESISWERELLAVAPSGETISLLVTKEETQGQFSSFSVSDVEENRVDNPITEDTLPDQVTKVGPAFELANELTQLPPVDYWGFWLVTPPHSYLEEIPKEKDSHYYFFWFEEPEPPDTFMISPSYVVIDGSTGNLIMFERHKMDLPFDGRYLNG